MIFYIIQTNSSLQYIYMCVCGGGINDLLTSSVCVHIVSGKAINDDGKAFYIQINMQLKTIIRTDLIIHISSLFSFLFEIFLFCFRICLVRTVLLNCMNFSIIFFPFPIDLFIIRSIFIQFLSIKSFYLNLTKLFKVSVQHNQKIDNQVSTHFKIMTRWTN